MKVNYVAKKAVITSITLLRVIFFWLIIPLIIMIVSAIQKANHKYEFYDKCIIERYGILSKNERKMAFSGIVAISVKCSLFGRIFGYGDVYIDVVGKNNLILDGVKKPFKLKEYIETKLIEFDNKRVTFVE